MNDIDNLYQELIIDHSRSPKNYGSLSDKSHHARGHNPLCGDVIDLDVKVENNVISAIKFVGDGCAISTASASLMTECLNKKTVTDALDIFNLFHKMLTQEDNNPTDLGKLNVLRGVRQFPIRIKCATLCWHTLNAALKNNKDRVTTE